MAKEIERKFLFTPGNSYIPAEITSEKRIIQGYIYAGDGKQVRIRIFKYANTDKIAMLCVKYTGSLVRDEFEYRIPLEDGLAMYEKCKWTVEKDRISFMIEDYLYDIDIYPNGLAVIEVEFPSIHHIEIWKKPVWIGEEITSNPEYSNITLAKQNLKF